MKLFARDLEKFLETPRFRKGHQFGCQYKFDLLGKPGKNTLRKSLNNVVNTGFF